jgi:acyl carrier protein
MLDIAERTRTIVVQQLFVDPDEVVDSASFIDDLGADSLDMVELALKFEREFGFEISDGLDVGLERPEHGCWAFP